jgi:hypothetical protein
MLAILMAVAATLAGAAAAPSVRVDSSSCAMGLAFAAPTLHFRRYNQYADEADLDTEDAFHDEDEPWYWQRRRVHDEMRRTATQNQCLGADQGKHEGRRAPIAALMEQMSKISNLCMRGLPLPSAPASSPAAVTVLSEEKDSAREERSEEESETRVSMPSSRLLHELHVDEFACEERREGTHGGSGSFEDEDWAVRHGPLCRPLEDSVNQKKQGGLDNVNVYILAEFFFGGAHLLPVRRGVE